MPINDTYRRIKHRAMAMLQNISFSTTNTNDIVLKVNDFVRQRYDQVQRAYRWSQLTRSYSFSLVASTTDYALRRDVEEVYKIIDVTNGREIKRQTLDRHIRFDAPVLEVAGNVLTGQPENWYPIGDKSVSALLSQADTVQVLSSSASDVSPKVIRIKGLVSGVEMGESLTLTGTSPVTSTRTYDSGSELIISAGTSDGTISDLVGTVTVREASTTTNVLAKLAPGERSFQYQWIGISPQPPSTGSMPSLKVWFKKRVNPILDDNDAPEIPCANELVSGVIADLLWEDGQPQEAQIWETKFVNGVQELWNTTNQRSRILQFVPENEDTLDYNERVFFI